MELRTFRAVPSKMSFELDPTPPSPNGVVDDKHDFSVQVKTFYAIPRKKTFLNPLSCGGQQEKHVLCAD